MSAKSIVFIPDREQLVMTSSSQSYSLPFVVDSFYPDLVPVLTVTLAGYQGVLAFQ
jgi:hypothetical protein